MNNLIHLNFHAHWYTIRICGLESFSSAPVSRAVQELDAELEEWRQRPLGTFPQVIIDARDEKARVDGAVRKVAVLVAVGIDPDGRRHVLGLAVAPSEAEVHWRAFLDSLVVRGLHGVELVTSDCHAGARGALRAVFPTATWQRCQFHLVRNAQRQAPNRHVRAGIAAELRELWNCPDRTAADAALHALVAQYRSTAPTFAQWLAANVPDGLGVFSQPAAHRVRLRTTNMLERGGATGGEASHRHGSTVPEPGLGHPTGYGDPHGYGRKMGRRTVALSPRVGENE